MVRVPLLQPVPVLVRPQMRAHARFRTPDRDVRPARFSVQQERRSLQGLLRVPLRSGLPLQDGRFAARADAARYRLGHGAVVRIVVVRERVRSAGAGREELAGRPVAHDRVRRVPAAGAGVVQNFSIAAAVTRGEEVNVAADDDLAGGGARDGNGVAVDVGHVEIEFLGLIAAGGAFDFAGKGIAVRRRVQRDTAGPAWREDVRGCSGRGKDGRRGIADGGRGTIIRAKVGSQILGP